MKYTTPCINNQLWLVSMFVERLWHREVFIVFPKFLISLTENFGFSGRAFKSTWPCIKRKRWDAANWPTLSEPGEWKCQGKIFLKICRIVERNEIKVTQDLNKKRAPHHSNVKKLLLSNSLHEDQHQLSKQSYRLITHGSIKVIRNYL